MVKNPNRRQVLRSIGALFATYYVPYNSKSESLTPANLALIDFPDELPGSVRVDKYMTPNAKFCLVHIRQMHFAVGATPEEENNIIAVQSDIYSMLDYLIEHEGLKNVYGEGVFETTELSSTRWGRRREQLRGSFNNQRRYTPLFIDIINQHQRKIDELKYDVQSEGYVEAVGNLNSGTEDMRDLLEEKIQRLMNYENYVNEEIEEIRRIKLLYSGAEGLLESEGRIKIRAGETKVAHDRCTKNWHTEERYDFLDDREEVLLKKVSEHNEPLAVTVYGGLHAFGGRDSFGEDYLFLGRPEIGDNIAEWNQQHPHEKFSLIEITPNSY